MKNKFTLISARKIERAISYLDQYGSWLYPHQLNQFRKIQHQHQKYKIVSECQVEALMDYKAYVKNAIKFQNELEEDFKKHTL